MAAATKRVVRRENRSKGGLTKTAIAAWFRQWVTADHEAKAANARKSELRDRFMEALERQGYEDDKGHLYIDLPEEIEGYTKVCRQLRVSQSVDPDEAEALLKEKGLWKDCTDVVRVLNESKMAQMVFEGRLTQEEFDSTVKRKETPAFVPVR